jgi:hypothetical protein
MKNLRIPVFGVWLSRVSMKTSTALCHRESTICMC